MTNELWPIPVREMQFSSSPKQADTPSGPPNLILSGKHRLFLKGIKQPGHEINKLTYA